MPLMGKYGTESRTPLRLLLFKRLLPPAPFLRPGIIIWVATLFAGGLLPAGNYSLELVGIKVDPNTVVARISPDFIGFGYERSAGAETH